VGHLRKTIRKEDVIKRPVIKRPTNTSNSTKRARRARVLFLVLASYVFLQLAWWADLIIRSASRLYEANLETKPLAQAALEWERTVFMVAWEGSVFAVLFVFGLVWLWKVISADNNKLARERNFILAVTHELKTPIAAIRLAIDTVDRLDLDKKEEKELLDEARSGTLRLERRVEDILQATRLNLPDALLTLPFSICDSTENAVNKFTRLYPDSQIVFSKKGDDKIIDGDHEMWMLCITNLLENAYKYGGDSKQVEVVFESSLRKNTLYIIDHGPGIEESDRENIFEAFYRLRRDKDIDGTGLGLHLVNKIVQMHGATISVNPTDGGGATFTITLPGSF
jgi:two-component system phosphate regulon sensor histidine kinase PhoR